MGRRIAAYASTAFALAAVLAGLELGIPRGTAHAANFPIPDGDVAGLIDAIDTANANGEVNTIMLAANGTYSIMSPAVTPVTGGNTGLPLITSRMSIQGNGATIRRGDGSRRWVCPTPTSPQFRILFVTSEGSLTLENVTVRNGCETEFGGAGIWNRGTVTIRTSIFRDHSANSPSGTSAGGGVILNQGGMEVLDSAIIGNSANTSFLAAAAEF